MNALDVVLVLLAILFAVLGWRVGLVRVALGLLGLVLGAAVGYLTAELALHRFELAVAQPAAVVLAAAAVGAVLGQLVVALPGQSLHVSVAKSRVAPFNQGLGSVVSLATLAVLLWAMATALALLPGSTLGSLMRGSAVLAGMDRAVSADAGVLFNRLERSVEADASPRVFTGLGLFPLADVPAPDPADVPDGALAAAQESVVRVLGRTQCGATLVGSGVIVAPGLVITNAHVVAGMAEPIVTPQGRTLGLAGTVVAFEPGTDAALVKVPELPGRPLPLAAPPGEGQQVAVAGYPGGGELQVSAAAVRGTVTATGEDIYGGAEVQRQVVVISGTVSPGNSGGPLLTAEGEIAGLVFATATREDEAGYALSTAEVARILDLPRSPIPEVTECLPAASR